jgi:hypothetical protein
MVNFYIIIRVMKVKKIRKWKRKILIIADTIGKLNALLKSIRWKFRSWNLNSKKG